MTEKHELAILRELIKVYRSCPERVAAYVRWRWISLGIAWSLIFIAFLLISFGNANSRICMLMTLVGGFAGGLSFLFSSSAHQMPFLVQYSELRDDEVQRRLQKLETAQAGRDEPPPRSSDQHE